MTSDQQCPPTRAWPDRLHAQGRATMVAGEERQDETMPNLNRLFRGPMAYLLLILVLVFLFFRFFAAGPRSSRPACPTWSRHHGRPGQGDHPQGPGPEDHGHLHRRAQVRGLLHRAPGQGPVPAGQGRGHPDPGRRPRPVGAGPDPHPAAPLRRAPAAVLLPHAADAGRRQPGDELRQVQGPPGHQGPAQDHLRRTWPGSTRRSRSSQEIKEFLENPAKFQAMGAKIPKGVLLFGPPGHGQDPARPGRGRRGRGAVLLHLRLRLRGDVRRRRRLPRPRPVRAGQGERPRDRVRGRDRRRRPPARGRPRRRPRRARADPEPAAGRDGRLRRRSRA